MKTIRVIHEYRRQKPSERVARVEEHVARVLAHLDPNPNRPGLDDTPNRVARMYVEELTRGYEQDPKALLSRTFAAEGYAGQVIVRDVPVYSLCEHHLMPFVGKAHVGYFPGKRVVGLSKIARVVDVFARRLQIQERLTEQIARALHDALDPRGVIVVVEAEHFCMTFRGVQAPGALTTTSTVRGLYDDNSEGEKDEFLSLIRKETA